MKNIILFALLICVGWYGYGQYQRRSHVVIPDDVASSSPGRVEGQLKSLESQFKCDGRTYCSQMTSCAEATYFLQHCPGTKMDGNNDGVPCEQQWCR
ncbi:MAG: excalibur calcium-binding domain-containing protein [Betaproteobacteria bacterium]